MTKVTPSNTLNEHLLNIHQSTITNYMYLGLLPFFIGAFGPWVLIDYEPFFIKAFFLYSSIIFSFLAGALWAIALFIMPNKTIGDEQASQSDSEHSSRYIHSAIIFSLWPLICYFLAPLYATGAMLLGFLLLLLWEKKAMNTLYPLWYQALRHKITFIVIACHMLTLLNIIRA